MTAPASTRFPCRAELAAKRQAWSWKREKASRRFGKGIGLGYADNKPGAYCDERVMDAARVVKLPDSVTDRDAAALMLKGLTAWFLLRRCHRVRRNEPILLHAAAGGVGLIALQWAAVLGAKVIAVVGSDEKAALVRELGAAEVVVSTRENIVERVRGITRKRASPSYTTASARTPFSLRLIALRRSVSW